MSLPLACLGQDADLLGQEVDRLHGPVTLVRRCGDLVEMLAVVRSGLALAVLVDAEEPELSAQALDALRRDGAVVAVVVQDLPGPAAEGTVSHTQEGIGSAVVQMPSALRTMPPSTGSTSVRSRSRHSCRPGRRPSC